MSHGSVRVAISDPLPLFRRGIASVLSTDGHAADEPIDLLEWSADDMPGLVVIGLTNDAQWRLLSDLGRKRPALWSVALLEDTAAASRAVLDGAAAVLSRDVSPKQLREACRVVVRGQCVLPTAVVRDLLHRVARWDDQVRLTDDELAWLRDLAEGRTVAAVAGRSGYSERMMFRLLRDVYAKLNVASRTEALLLARERGWM